MNNVTFLLFHQGMNVTKSFWTGIEWFVGPSTCWFTSGLRYVSMKNVIHVLRWRVSIGIICVSYESARCSFRPPGNVNRTNQINQQYEMRFGPNWRQLE